VTRLAEIESRIGSMGELLNIVGAMRSLAGMRVQEALRALPGIRRYAETVAEGLGETLLLLGGERLPSRREPARLALVLYAAEHGLAGGFNEKLMDAAEAQLGPRDRLFVLGSRGAALAVERGLAPCWHHPMATRSAAVPETAERLSAALYRHISEEGVTRVEVIFCRYREGGTGTIERRQLLPLDAGALAAGQPRQAPLSNLEAAALHQRLIAEYVFAALSEAAMETIASENAARLAAMVAAHDNVSHKLDSLHNDARRMRQSEITAEILELVAAAKALDEKP
jgi:F-type H+-transporting ATPase subunit gamma